MNNKSVALYMACSLQHQSKEEYYLARAMFERRLYEAAAKLQLRAYKLHKASLKWMRIADEQQ